MNHKCFTATNILKVLAIIMLLTVNANCLYFELSQKRPRCFIEELYKGNMAMIKYSIFNLKGEQNEHTELLSNISISIVSETDKNEVLLKESLKSSNGKFGITAPRDGQYRVCTHFQSTSWVNKFKLTMNIKILSDNMDEPDLTKAIKKTEIQEMNQKLETIIRKGENYIRSQESMMRIEDKDSKKIMLTQSRYFYFTLFQIIIVMVIGIYHIYNFKNFVGNQ